MGRRACGAEAVVAERKAARAPHAAPEPRRSRCERVITCRAGVTTSRTNKNDSELLTKAYIRGHFTIDQRWW